MYKDIKKFNIIGTIFTVITGTLLHFVYEWTNSNPIAAIFSPINESVWEHLKLIFYPMTIYLFYGYFKFGKKYNNYTTAAVIGTLTSILSVIVLFYTYTGIIGKSFFIMDILVYIIAVAAGFLITYFIIKNYALTFISPRMGIVIIEIIFLLFAIFTLFSPDIPLFIPPE